jgi:uncharacterized protein (DUF2147 family)
MTICRIQYILLWGFGQQKTTAMKKVLSIIITFLILNLADITASSVQPEPDYITGHWINETEEVVITIYKKDGKYYGKISWLKRMHEPDGSLRKDVNNPESDLRSRPLNQIELLKGFIYDGNGTWVDGKVYNPRSGRTYQSRMIMTGPDEVNVRGYIGIPALGRSLVWTRL